MLEFHLLLDQMISFCGRPCIGTHMTTTATIWEFQKIIGFLVFQPQNVRNMMKHLTLIFKNHFNQVGISPIISVIHYTPHSAANPNYNIYSIRRTQRHFLKKTKKIKNRTKRVKRFFIRKKL